MSNQDNQFCEQCGKPCGYDDDKANLSPGYLCGLCKKNLIRRFSAVFGLDSASSGDFGLEIEYKDLIRILSKLKRDEYMRITYYVTDKELYERRADIPTSVFEPVRHK